MNNLLGIGLYSLAEASALTGIPTKNIKRWIFGCATSSGDYHNGLWESQISELGYEGISFRDLLEIRFVNAFRKHGVSLQSIRIAVNHAQEMFNSKYPFTYKQFRTDGRSIFADTLEETGDKKLIDLVKKQYVFKQIISPSLYRGIEYNKEGDARLWYPLGNSKKIVLDPARSFGRPIVTDRGIPTETLYQTSLVEDDINFVANIYGITPAEVKAAIQFEEGIKSGE